MLLRHAAYRLPYLSGPIKPVEGTSWGRGSPWDDDGAKDIFQLQPLEVTCIMAPRFVDLVLPFPSGSAVDITSHSACNFCQGQMYA